MVAYLILGFDCWVLGLGCFSVACVLGLVLF